MCSGVQAVQRKGWQWDCGAIFSWEMSIRRTRLAAVQCGVKEIGLRHPPAAHYCRFDLRWDDVGIIHRNGSTIAARRRARLSWRHSHIQRLFERPRRSGIGGIGDARRYTTLDMSWNLFS